MDESIKKNLEPVRTCANCENNLAGICCYNYATLTQEERCRGKEYCHNHEFEDAHNEVE